VTARLASTRSSEIVRVPSVLRRKTSRYCSVFSTAVGKFAFEIWMFSSSTSRLSLSMSASAVIQMTP
jgi:hypothetical protein